MRFDITPIQWLIVVALGFSPLPFLGAMVWYYYSRCLIAREQALMVRQEVQDANL